MRSVHEAGASNDLGLVVERLRDLVAAIDRTRAMGLPVAVPEPLYRACLDVVSRRTPGTAESSPEDPPTGARVEWARLKDVPLRRLVWQVIDPGETVTVAEVTNRLAGLGATWPQPKISNALGYWVARGRLERERKGRYHYPVTSVGHPTRSAAAGRPGPVVGIA